MAKNFKLLKTEYHQINIFYESILSEDDVLYIFEQAEIDPNDQKELLVALEDEEHDRYYEVMNILLESTSLSDIWESAGDDMWTDRTGEYIVDIAVESVEDDGQPSDESGTVH